MAGMVSGRKFDPHLKADRMPIRQKTGHPYIGLRAFGRAGALAQGRNAATSGNWGPVARRREARAAIIALAALTKCV